MARPAEKSLLDGLRAYDDAQYETAERQFKQALALGLAAPKDRAEAHKRLAFIDCAADRLGECEAEFRARPPGRPQLHAQPVRGRASGVGAGLPQGRPELIAPARRRTHDGRPGSRQGRRRRGISPRRPRLLGRHGRRRHRLLRQLPEVLRTGAHRVAAQPRLRAGAPARRRRHRLRRHRDFGALSSAGAARRHDRGHGAGRHRLGQASLDVAQQARRGGDLLAEGTIRVGCVELGTFRPRRIPDDILGKIQNSKR